MTSEQFVWRLQVHADVKLPDTSITDATGALPMLRLLKGHGTISSPARCLQAGSRLQNPEQVQQVSLMRRRAAARSIAGAARGRFRRQTPPACHTAGSSIPSRPNFEHGATGCRDHRATVFREVLRSHDQIENRQQYPALIEIHWGSSSLSGTGDWLRQPILT